MGDVIEHVFDPSVMIKKASEFLNEGGVLWVSTPDFTFDFTKNVGHDDPMRRESFHINYFSKASLYMLLEKCGFKIVDYRESTHYNGSMEVIALKKKTIE